MLIMNFSSGNIYLVVVFSILRGIGYACGGATMWAMVSDTIDYGEWKTGVRTEGLVNSACSFGYKIGNGVGSVLLGIVLELVDMLGQQLHSLLLRSSPFGYVLYGFQLLLM